MCNGAGGLRSQALVNLSDLPGASVGLAFQLKYFSILLFLLST